MMDWRALAVMIIAIFKLENGVFGHVKQDCRTATNCTACIFAGPLCAWCFQKDFVLTVRCDQLDVLESRGCNRSYIFYPKSKITLLQNDAHRNADFTLEKPSVQLAPQHVWVRLVPGKPVNISLQLRVATDYPVDLYYLMDLSLSMHDDLESLTKLGFNLRDTLLNVTRNVKLGFGAFVDKPIMPFIDVRPEVLENVCQSAPEKCSSKPYGYINRLPLTSDTNLFVSRVSSSAISINLDGAEGGLDALVQAIVCQENVGWRAQARKLLIYATDDVSHISGDGKLAGVVEPHDGRCHMAEDQYTHSSIMDYPSIGQIANIVNSKSVNVIFAIAEKFKDVYEELEKLIPGSVVGVLTNSSSNVVELVKNSFQAIIAKAELRIDGLDSDGVISVKTSSSCGSGLSNETRVCDGLKVGDTVSFDVQLELQSCPTSAYRGNISRKVLYLSIVGIDEKLQIDVDIDCECDCDDKVPNSSHCSSKGLFTCGECHCDTGYTGSRCECDRRAAIPSVPTFHEQCIRPGNIQPCSGRGSCTDCGSCECSCLHLAGTDVGYCAAAGDRYSGKYCECNPRGCNSFKGLMCGGEGACLCDTEGNNYCDCNEQYDNGDLAACDCPKSTVTCKNDQGVICNSKGVCACGVCHCNDTCYTGATCSILRPECSGICQELRPCVKCLQLTGKPCPDGCQNVTLFSSRTVPAGSLQTCRYHDDEDCEVAFVFSYDRLIGRNMVDALHERKCPPNLTLILITAIVGGVLFIVILALLTWKAVISIHDKKEYEKFEKEAQRVHWKEGVSPLYEQATSTFKNPTYAGNQ